MNKVDDLRSAIELIQSIPGEYVETDVEVDPKAELSGVYRHVGAGGTVMRPTKIGPAMMFNNVKGHPGARVIIGMLASRKRVAIPLIRSTLPERKPPVRKSYTTQQTKALISAIWFRHPPTHRKTPVRTSRWVWLTPAIRRQASLM